jgi:hypothetical protein
MTTKPYRLDWARDHWDVIIQSAKTADGDAVMTLDEFLDMADDIRHGLLSPRDAEPQRPASPRRD